MQPVSKPVSTRGIRKKAFLYTDPKKNGAKTLGKRKYTTKTERKRLFLYADKAVSFHVIHRDKFCVTCGAIDQLSCSHLFRRGRMPLRFDLFNCNCQCITCNGNHNVNPEPYNNWFIKKYGQQKFDELYRASWELKKWRNSDLNEVLSLMDKLNKKYLD